MNGFGRRSIKSDLQSAGSAENAACKAVPPIHIIVNNGNVTLEGVVASEADKNVAEIQAKSVSGVFSVKSNLRIEA